ncbi:hypothetical protein ALC56_02628 [Trachymyrmex septentrionalis]|uniref:Uncharacterized protein n=1 Tax=Trachymyrmex septentrionalis TaxID=34720 RepID=A0A195FQX4_9HYME|nr:hypothetical protein ALC56_02628 [Trachymyrmex septentrionalis]
MLAHHAAPPVNSCPPGVGRGVHPFLYRWTNAPTRNPVPSSAYVAKVLHPLLDSTSSGQTARSEMERAPKRSGEPARRGDTTLLTRVRCAHLGVTHSFVPSDQRGRRRGRKRERALVPVPLVPRRPTRLASSITLPRSPSLPPRHLLLVFQYFSFLPPLLLLPRLAPFLSQAPGVYSVIARPSRTTALDFRRRSLDFHLIPPNRIWILPWQFEMDFPYASKKICISQSRFNPTRQDEHLASRSNFYHHIERMPAIKQARERASLRRGTGAVARDGGSISNYKRRRTFSSRYVTVGVENDRAASGDSTAPMRSVTRCSVQRRELLYSRY